MRPIKKNIEALYQLYYCIIFLFLLFERLIAYRIITEKASLSLPLNNKNASPLKKHKKK